MTLTKVRKVQFSFAKRSSFWSFAGRNSSSYILLALLSLAISGKSQAQSQKQTPPSQDPPDSSLFGLSLEQLSEIQIQSASLISKFQSNSPAIVSVILREEMEVWGDRSVADALARVPGLYRVDLQGIQDVGIRGLFGGQRSWNRQLKVLIDGQIHSFRPDASNFLGPEFLPMSVIERIEVIRGPSSAIYGADAFLGTVNIITKNNLQKEHIQKSLNATVKSYVGSARGLDVYFAGGSGNLSSMLAIQAEDYQLNSLRIPAGSPILNANPALRSMQSNKAYQQPLSLMASSSYRTETVSHKLDLNYSRMDSKAQFLDVGALNKDNRWAQTMSQLTWETQWKMRSDLNSKFHYNFSKSTPLDQDKLYLTSTSTTPFRREFASTYSELGANINWLINDNHALSAGFDHYTDKQQSIEIRRLNADGSSTLFSNPSSHLTLKNTGVFAEYAWQATKKFGLTLNARDDKNSEFGHNHNWRTTAVLEHDKSLNTKLIWSTSYKAPSVFDLLAQPLFSGDVIGNRKLKAETAKNVELQINWSPVSSLQWSTNLYRLEVNNKIDLQPTGLNYQPVNRGKFSGTGIEFDLNWEFGSHRIGLAGAKLNLREKLPIPLIGIQIKPPERYPEQTFRLHWRWKTAQLGQFASEIQYASKRYASFSNSFANFLTPYSLGSSTRLNMAWTKNINAHTIHIRIDNALNRPYSEAGYGGTDIPGRGRSARVTYQYQWK